MPGAGGIRSQELLIRVGIDERDGSDGIDDVDDEEVDEQFS